MTTYKISFLAPSRKASSMDSKRSTQDNLQPLYRKNSRTKRDNVEPPITLPLKSYRKNTLTEARNKSTYDLADEAKRTWTS